MKERERERDREREGGATLREEDRNYRKWMRRNKRARDKKRGKRGVQGIGEETDKIRWNTERQIDRQTDRQKDRQTDREMRKTAGKRQVEKEIHKGKHRHVEFVSVHKSIENGTGDRCKFFPGGLMFAMLS